MSVPVAGSIPPRIVIHDTRIARSRAFGEAAAAHGFRRVDVAGQEALLWREARAGFGLHPGGLVIALTRWSDRVSLGGLFGERGLRFVEERSLPGGLVHWAMA